jgi:riboflavin kinase / FMN adenylyltransferase
MRVARALEEAVEFGPTAVTIGNFDGVHVGHRRLLQEVVSAAQDQGVESAVLTFDPHPASIVAPARVGRLLSTHAERCSIMARAGIDHVLILPFTSLIARWSPEQFVERVLAKSFHARTVVVGENFRFGHKQAGDTKVLAELGAKYGFDVRVVSPVKLRGRIVSSSEIRRAVESGNVSLAARFLGRPFALEGQVVAGHGIGSKQTVPTLNLSTRAQVLPAAGVYITRTTDLDTDLSSDKRSWNSITNVGYRPTFEDQTGGDLSIETFLLDPFTAPNPETIRVEFLRHLRVERKFESPEALKAQIMRDVSRAQAFFRRTKRWIAPKYTSLT